MRCLEFMCSLFCAAIPPRARIVEHAACRTVQIADEPARSWTPICLASSSVASGRSGLRHSVYRYCVHVHSRDRSGRQISYFVELWGTGREDERV